MYSARRHRPPRVVQETTASRGLRTIEAIGAQTSRHPCVKVRCHARLCRVATPYGDPASGCFACPGAVDVHVDNGDVYSKYRGGVQGAKPFASMRRWYLACHAFTMVTAMLGAVRDR